MAPSSDQTLSPRETEVLGLLARGVCSNAALAARLVVSPNTVRWHLRSLCTKLEVHSRAELVVAYYRGEAA